VKRGGYLRTVAIAASSNATVQILGTGSGLALAYLLQPEGRGAYAAVLAWSGALSVIGALGIPAALCYFVALGDRRADVLRTGQSLVFGLSFGATLVGLAATPLLARDNHELALAYAIGFLSLPVTFLSGTWIFALQGADMRRWAGVRLAHPVAYLALLAVLYGLDALTVPWVVAAVTASAAVQSLVAYRAWKRVSPGRGAFDRRLASPLTAYGLRTLAAQAPFLLNSRVDQLVLSVAVPLEDLGVYAVAVSVTLLVFPLTSAFGNVALPRIARENRTDPRAAQVTWRLAVVGSLVIGGLGAAAVAALTPVVFPIVFGDSYEGVEVLVYILAPGAVLLGLNHVLGDVLRGYDQALLVARAEGVAAVVTLVLMAALIPSLGATGAAIGSTCSYGVSAAMLLRFAARHSLARSEAQPRSQPSTSVAPPEVLA
jgi:O-antigen/teichoic acid export membrane protein